ncbi:MAG: pitrilysin family protein [Oceanicoccus sp.]
MFNRYRVKNLLSVGTVAVVLTLNAITAQAALKLQPITSVEGITEYQLDNGLQVLLFPDQTKETVTVNVTYHVGSKHENYGETGMAHLLEHLVFKGTPRHPDIPSELSSHGARPNGSTWTDRTNYFETFSATKENIEWALDMEADRMVNSFIAKKDLDSEMTVVRNELERGENSPFRVTLERIMSSAYTWHNYGKSTIGARSDLENVPIDRLQAFYRKYYQPDNATLIVAGKFDNDEMLKRVKKYFGPIPKPDRILARTYTEEPAQDGEKNITVRRVGDVQLFMAAYHIPAGSHPDYAAIDVLSQVLGDTPSGRLHKQLVEKKLASRAFASNFQWRDPGVAIFGIQVDKEGDLTASSQQMLAVLEDISVLGITDEEVERVKRNMLKNIELSFNSSERFALNLSEWLGMGDWRLFFMHRDRIEKVTTADVQRVAEAYLQTNNRTAGRFIPTEKPERIAIPMVTNVAEMLEGYVGKPAIAQGENFEPSFDNIDKRTEILKLDNGVGISLLPKKTRGETVVVSIQLGLGDEHSLIGMRATGSAVGAMLMRGTTDLSREQLQIEFDKLKANVHVDASASAAYAKVTTTRENLRPVLQLIATVFKNPSFDKDEFDQYKSTLEVDIEQNLQDPQQLAFREYARKQNPFPQQHPLYQPTLEQELAAVKALKHKDLNKFHQRFYGASHMQIGLIGDFEKSDIVPELNTIFGQWKSEIDYQRIPHAYQRVDTNTTNFDTPDKENAVFLATMAMPIGDNATDAAALELGNYIFGGGFLNSRLATRLRQQDGLSYSVRSVISQSPYDDRTSIVAFAICAPQNLSRVEQGFKDELARMLDTGFTETELIAAKSGLLQSKKVARAQDSELVEVQVNHLELERSMQWNKAYEERLDALTVEDVKAVMNKYLNVDDFSLIKAGDMSKIEAP